MECAAGTLGASALRLALAAHAVEWGESTEVFFLRLDNSDALKTIMSLWKLSVCLRETARN